MSTLTFSNVYDTYRQSYLVTSVLPTVLMMSDGGMAKCDLIACVLYIVYPDDDDQDTLFPRWWLRPPVLPCTAPLPSPFTIKIILYFCWWLMMMMLNADDDADAADWWLVMDYEVMLSCLTAPLPKLLPGPNKEEDRSSCKLIYRYKFKFKHKYK